MCPSSPYPSMGRHELLVLERLEERIDAVPDLRFRVVARILEVGLHEERRNAELSGEVLAHVALARREESARFDGVDDESVGLPVFHVATDLRVARDDRAVGEVLA